MLYQRYLVTLVALACAGAFLVYTHAELPGLYSVFSPPVVDGRDNSVDQGDR